MAFRRTSPSHAAAVEALRASYDGVPVGQPVRLAKRTSNLFRRRRASDAPGLEVRALNRVLRVDADARTADVQGMCTYEDLVEQTLRYGLVPLVVPQLRTITVGGAVAGLGVESSSFRNGLPHESVVEMDVLTGDGRLLTCTPRQHGDLFRAFPNSYGSLGYAVRLRIELEPARPLVALRQVRFRSFADAAAALGEVVDARAFEGERVDFLDGVVFGPHETYLTLGRWAGSLRDAGGAPSDYTGQAVYYRSLRERSRDVLTVRDYLWRWDTDWFWCSRALGAQHPLVRRLWPSRWRRSDVYHRLVRLDQNVGVSRRLDAARGQPAREHVVQDVEIPLERTAGFLDWFTRSVPMSPVWLCPLRVRAADPPDLLDAEHPWPLYPLRGGQVYVNVGFWGTVPIATGGADGDVNRLVERAVADHGGHKSLYSDAFYPPEEFDRLYGAEAYRRVKESYDPQGRLTGLYEKVVGRR